MGSFDWLSTEIETGWEVTQWPGCVVSLYVVKSWRFAQVGGMHRLEVCTKHIYYTYMQCPILYSYLELYGNTLIQNPGYIRKTAVSHCQVIVSATCNFSSFSVLWVTAEWLLVKAVYI